MSTQNNILFSQKALLEDCIKYIESNKESVVFITKVVFVNQGDDTYNFYYDFLKNSIICMDECKALYFASNAKVGKILKKIFSIPLDYNIKKVEAFYDDTLAFEPFNELLKMDWNTFYTNHPVTHIRIWSI
jgi:hypothetical protein